MGKVIKSLVNPLTILINFRNITETSLVSKSQRTYSIQISIDKPYKEPLYHSNTLIPLINQVIALILYPINRDQLHSFRDLPHKTACNPSLIPILPYTYPNTTQASITVIVVV